MAAVEGATGKVNRKRANWQPMGVTAIIAPIVASGRADQRTVWR